MSRGGGNRLLVVGTTSARPPGLRSIPGGRRFLSPLQGSTSLSRRFQGTFESRLQYRGRQMPEQRGEAHFRCIGLATAEALHGIAADVERAIEGFCARPDPAALRERGE